MCNRVPGEILSGSSRRILLCVSSSLCLRALIWASLARSVVRSLTVRRRSNLYGLSGFVGWQTSS